MAMEKRDALAGNEQWRHFLLAIEAGQGGGTGYRPRGATLVGGSPTEPLTQLPEDWDADVAHASHVVYHYGTPVAWIDSRDGGWVMPEVKYSPSTSGVQNRIREYLGAGHYRTTVRD